MPSERLITGLYSQVDGVEYKVVRAFGWCLWSYGPAPGFRRMPGKTGHYRKIDRREGLPYYRVLNSGTYLGVPVEVAESTEDRFVLWASDKRAVDAGFSQQGRSEFMKFVSKRDPNLRWTTTRIPLPAPWL